jgi:hypothetical protein
MEKRSEVVIESYVTMAADQQREREAAEWSEALIGDVPLNDSSE